MKRSFEKVSFATFKQNFSSFPDEVVTKIYNAVKLPTRKTKYSAGYDFYSPIAFSLEPGDSFIIPTGVKAYMNNGEFGYSTAMAVVFGMLLLIVSLIQFNVSKKNKD